MIRKYGDKEIRKYADREMRRSGDTGCDDKGIRSFITCATDS